MASDTCRYSDWRGHDGGRLTPDDADDESVAESNDDGRDDEDRQRY